MPYSSITDLPASFKNFTANQKRWVLPVLNALLKLWPDDEGKAIRIAIGNLNKHFRLNEKTNGK